MSKKVVVIGAGFGGLSAASMLTKQGYEVHVYEKNSNPGGRTNVYHADGFKFDMGPSWYLMPDAFETFFKQFDKSPSDYYQLIKLDPAYKVYFSDNESILVKPDIDYMADEFEKLEKGAGVKFKKHMHKMKKKYELAVPRFLLKDYSNPTELLDMEIFKHALSLELTNSYHNSIAKSFKSPKIQKILEFMAVFLGGSPYKLPGLYNLINWADFGLNVYYPQGGFFEVSKGLEKLAKELGVMLHYNKPVSEIVVENGKTKGIVAGGEMIEADLVVANADYQFVEEKLLKEEFRQYASSYWEKADMSPSGVCIFLGLNKTIPNLTHHTMVFSEGWENHFESIEKGKMPDSPQYYISTPSKTDESVAPEGKENIFILVPISPYLTDNEENREKIFDYVMEDIKKKIGVDIRKHILHKRIFAQNDFINEYNAYKGNAFGLGHTLKHSITFRPPNKHKKVKGLYFVGQYTNPGTGTPLVLLSGILVSQLVQKHEK